MSKGFSSNYRLVLVATAVLVSFAGVGVRLVDLHVLDRDRLVSYVDQARHTVQIDQARRGDILDSRGDVLATSQTLVELAVDPWALEEFITFQSKQNVERGRRYAEVEQRKRAELAKVLHMSVQDVETMWQPGYREIDPSRDVRDGEQDGRIKSRWIKLHEGVAESVYADIQSINVGDKSIDVQKVPPELKGLPKGLTVRRLFQRIYPRNQLASHLIGFMNREDKPSGGIESFADFYLRGQDGWTESEKDGRRRELAQFRTRTVPANDGYSVVLSIDSAVQHLIESELDFIGNTYHPEKATIIVSDARSGFLLGMANYPTFNLNDYGNAPIALQRNVAVTDVFDPGSTFKIVAASGALNEGLVSPSTTFNCSIDSIDYKGKPRRFMPDDHHYDHPLSVAEIISHSSNIGAAQLGMKLGEQRLYETALAFGFGQKSGFPLGYESEGILNSPEKWSGLEITRIPAGYSISATPIQIHYAMASIASGGELFRPQVIREIRDVKGEPIYTFGGVVRHRVVKEQVAHQMARMLMGVTVEGTGKGAAIEGYEVAGKTGTAQKLIDGHYSKRNHVGSFVGFFPASNPRVVITVIVDDAHLDRGVPNYGSAVAVPAFRRVAEKLISYLDIKPAVEPSRPLYALKGGSR